MTYYEWLTPLGPELAAILAGFAWWGLDGGLKRTPLGDYYLQFAERHTGDKQSQR